MASPIHFIQFYSGHYPRKFPILPHLDWNKPMTSEFFKKPCRIAIGKKQMAWIACYSHIHFIHLFFVHLKHCPRMFPILPNLAWQLQLADLLVCMSAHSWIFEYILLDIFVLLWEYFWDDPLRFRRWKIFAGHRPTKLTEARTWLHHAALRCLELKI